MRDFNLFLFFWVSTYVCVLVHDTWLRPRITWSETCTDLSHVPKTHSNDIQEYSMELYQLFWFMKNQGRTNMAAIECGAAVRVLLYKSAVLVNPKHVPGDQEKYRCLFYDGRTTDIPKTLFIDYLDEGQERKALIAKSGDACILSNLIQLMQ